MSRKTRKKRASKTQSKKSTSSLLAGVFLVCALCTTGFGVYHLVLAAPPEEKVVLEVDPNVGLEAQVVELFTANGAEEMIPIIKCESQFKHFNTDGTVLKNKAGSSATGIAQILASAHPDPKVLEVFNKRHNSDLTIDDFDITTVEGNLGYALALYQVRGVRDWECSKKFRFQ